MATQEATNYEDLYCQHCGKATLLMAALPYMPFYPSDYFADAHHLTTVEHGAYFLLITSYWMRGEALPDDDRKLAKLTKLSPDEWSAVREELCEFFLIEDGLWKHKRIDADLEKVTEKVRKAKEAAEASARARENKRKANAKRMQSERSTDASTDVEPIKTKAKVKSPIGDINPLTPFGVDCPDWMPKEAYAGFVEMRQGMPKKDRLTKRAVELLIGKLDRFRQAGHDIEEILNTSVENNWKGVFAPKGNGGGDRGSGWLDGR